MKNLIKSEYKYLEIEGNTKKLFIVMMLLGITLAIVIGNLTGFSMTNIFSPTELLRNGYMLIYFIIPFQCNYFFLHNFESGSIKNIISIGTRKYEFVISKIFIQFKIILSCILINTLSGYLVHLLGSVLFKEIVFNFSFNLLLVNIFFILSLSITLTSLCAIILFLCIKIKKISMLPVFTFMIILVDFILSDLLSTKNPEISKNLFFPRMLTYSNLYVLNNNPLRIETVTSALSYMIIPAIIILVFISLSIYSFEKEDLII